MRVQRAWAWVCGGGGGSFRDLQVEGGSVEEQWRVTGKAESGGREGDLETLQYSGLKHKNNNRIRNIRELVGGWRASRGSVEGHEGGREQGERGRPGDATHTVE